MRKATILPNFQSLRGFNGYNVVTTGTHEIAIYKESFNKNGCSYIAEEIFVISKEEGRFFVDFAMLSDGSVYQGRVCDGIDILYQKKKIYLRGYSIDKETCDVSTFLIDENGNMIEEYEDIPYVA